MFIHKLRNKNLAEIFFRVKQKGFTWCEEAEFLLGLNKNPQLDMKQVNSGELVFPLPWIHSKNQDRMVEKIRAQCPAYTEELIKLAESICRKEFTFFGSPFKFEDNIAWCADPVTGTAWPNKFHTKVNIFGGDQGYGDVKYVWELNRHQFLVNLGKAYLITGEERFASTGLSMLEDWIQSNPYKIGINWTSALEVAVRCLSWCWTCALFRESSSFTHERHQVILRSLFQHAQYIDEHLSFYFSPYNHLIGEGTALFVVGSLFNWYPKANRWKKKGWKILEEEMPRQFYADGGGVEQASGYHHFTLGFYLQAILVSKHLGYLIPSSVWSILEKAFEFSVSMLKPDGLMPMIGDGDEGKALELWQPSVWDFRGFLAIGATLFQRKDFKMVAGEFPPDAGWILGDEGWDNFENLSVRSPSNTSIALHGSGYYIMRTAWAQDAHYLNFDCGEIGHGVHKSDVPSAAHGHADALTIEVACYGKPFIVDPGFFTYNGELNWHRYFRETEAHNTVVVDSQSQAEFCGRLKWSCCPETTLHHWISSGSLDYVEGSHNGYDRLPQPVIHRRSIMFVKPNYWLIRDELSGEGEHQLDRLFHFVPLTLTSNDETMAVHAQSASGVGLSLFPLEKEGTHVDILNQGDNPEDGWLAIGYDKKVAAPIARFRTVATLPIAFHTLLVPYRKNTPPIKIERVSNDDGCDDLMNQCFIIKSQKTQDIFLFTSGGREKSFNHTWKTDAKFAFFQLDERDEVKVCALVEGTTLAKDSTTYLRLNTKIDHAVLTVKETEAFIEVSELTQISTPFSKVRIVTSSS